jgi:FliI/YscN family ATPase
MDKTAIPVSKGWVTAVHEHVIDATLPGAKIGGRATIFPSEALPFQVEIAAVSGAAVRLVPLAAPNGVGLNDRVATDPLSGNLLCGRGLLGRILDALGNPMDGGPKLSDVEIWDVHRPAPKPLLRRPIDRQLVTGIRVIDGCLALGYGQRIGLFAGPGVGKSTLLGMSTRHAEVDVSVVCLVGERGREVNEFLFESLGKETFSSSVAVVASADAPPMARVRALDTATAIAEWFRAQGRDVLLVVDSLTRVVRAKRESAFTLGEPSVRGGYPASAFSFLPNIIERTGNDEKGSITAIYAVLTEGAGDDPVSEEIRSLVDGHIVLSNKRAQSGIRPAVDILRSVSRVFERVVPEHVAKAATRLLRLQSAYEENEDLILMGAYRRGTSKDTDDAINAKQAMEAFFHQGRREPSTLKETFEALLALVCV